MSNRSLIAQARAQIDNRRKMRQVVLAAFIHGSAAFFSGVTLMLYLAGG